MHTCVCEYVHTMETNVVLNQTCLASRKRRGKLTITTNLTMLSLVRIEKQEKF